MGNKMDDLIDVLENSTQIGSAEERLKAVEALVFAKGLKLKLSALASTVAKVKAEQANEA